MSSARFVSEVKARFEYLETEFSKDVRYLQQKVAELELRYKNAQTENEKIKKVLEEIKTDIDEQTERLDDIEEDMYEEIEEGEEVVEGTEKAPLIETQPETKVDEVKKDIVPNELPFVKLEPK